MHQEHTEARLWDLLPPDVITSVLGRLPFRDAWKCRSLNSCWASAVRASFPVELVIPAKRQNLAVKLRRLQRTVSQSSTTLPYQKYTFKLAGLLSVTECSNLLTSLTKQGYTEAPCQVLIQLSTPKAASLPEIQQRLATIVANTALLASQNIKMRISLDTRKIAIPPHPHVLSALAPVIQQYEGGPLDADSPRQYLLTDSHIEALLPGADCIRTLNLCWRLDSHSSLDLLARFGNLRQLELQLDEAAGLQHLSGLKGLHELHLSIRITDLADCVFGNILENNKDGLLHVSLSAGAWDDTTYKALLGLWKLRTFCLKVYRLRADNAKVVAQLRPSQSMKITFHKLAQLVVRRLPIMHNLTSLTLVMFDLTGTDFQPQPTLQALTLRNVCMRSSHLQQLVQSYPSLTQLNLHGLHGLLMSPDNLCTILQLPHLNTLCLSGLEGLSAADFSWMEALIRSQQSIGMAQPIIHVTCTVAEHTTSFCVDYTRVPVLCGTESDERRATHMQRCWAKVAYPSTRAVGLLQGISGRVCAHTRGLADTRTWGEVESKHPLGFLVAVAILGINIACLSCRPSPACASERDVKVAPVHCDAHSRIIDEVVGGTRYVYMYPTHLAPE